MYGCVHTRIKADFRESRRHVGSGRQTACGSKDASRGPPPGKNRQGSHEENESDESHEAKEYDSEGCDERQEKERLHEGSGLPARAAGPPA